MYAFDDFVDARLQGWYIGKRKQRRDRRLELLVDLVACGVEDGFQRTAIWSVGLEGWIEI